MKHIFWPEVDVKILEKGKKLSYPQLSCWHHDHLGLLEKSGKFTLLNKKVTPSGLIRAQVKFDQYISEIKTFFPQHWTREQVIKKINESLKNNYEIIQEVKNKTGKIIRYELEAKTHDNIFITMIIDSENTVITAFPSEKNFKNL